MGSCAAVSIVLARSRNSLNRTRGIALLRDRGDALQELGVAYLSLYSICVSCRPSLRLRENQNSVSGRGSILSLQPDLRSSSDFRCPRLGIRDRGSQHCQKRGLVLGADSERGGSAGPGWGIECAEA